ncbi:MAG: hypothetical protein K2X36_03640 [Microbacteriaceae bacterium]|nr:hypothetical protein [Microbacteriaceae bacterium]
MARTDTRKPHTVLLDFDGVLNIPRFSYDVEHRAFRGGTTPTDQDELAWLRKDAPDDLERVTLQGLIDLPVYGVVRRSVINELKAFAREFDARLFWATSWLTYPERLHEAATLIGLDFVQMPDMEGITPFNEPLYNVRGHWKTELAHLHVHRGHRVLWIDDQLEPRPARQELQFLSIIAPNTLYGLNLAHLDAMRAWADGSDVGVFDNQSHLGWGRSSASF